MTYESELNFVKKLLANLKIDFHINTLMEQESTLFHEFHFEKLVSEMTKQCRPCTIYYIHTQFMFNYVMLELPDTDEITHVYIGPYCLKEITSQDMFLLAEQFGLSSANLKHMEHFLHSLPLLSDDNMFQTILYTLGTYLWGAPENFHIQKSKEFSHLDTNSLLIQDVSTTEESHLSMKLLEKRYQIEHDMMQAVTAGHSHKAELYFSQLAGQQFEQRSNNPLRDLKNHGIILNSLLRIAAGNANVHPLHLDEISGRYARKLEFLTSTGAAQNLFKEMVRKYCLLVKNHSMQGYSLLVRKVISAISADLTADLTLKTQAAALNVNASYLSTLFKKETGMTLTEYVNRKRIEHAILLLNTTDMQIQMIAGYCGISDVNYFTKIFKKIVGRTPKEYREFITLVH